MGHNRTGQPCSVGRPTTNVPSGRPACPSPALRRRTAKTDARNNY